MAYIPQPGSREVPYEIVEFGEVYAIVMHGAVTAATAQPTSHRLKLAADGAHLLVVSLEFCPIFEADGLAALIALRGRTGPGFAVIAPPGSAASRTIERGAAGGYLNAFPSLEEAFGYLHNERRRHAA